MVGLVSGDLGLLAVGPPHVREEGAALRELFPAVLAEGPVVDFDPLANGIIDYFGHLMRRNVKIFCLIYQRYGYKIQYFISTSSI